METNRSVAMSDPWVPKYEPPEPDVVGAGALFSGKGRISRATFWKILLSVIGAAFVVWLAGPLIMQLAAVKADGGADVVRFAIQVTFVWIVVATSVKRFHDMDRSGWNALVLVIIPIAPLVLTFSLGSTAGTDGPNRFGTRAQRLRWSA